MKFRGIVLTAAASVWLSGCAGGPMESFTLGSPRPRRQSRRGRIARGLSGHPSRRQLGRRLLPRGQGPGAHRRRKPTPSASFPMLDRQRADGRRVMMHVADGHDHSRTDAQGRPRQRRAYLGFAGPPGDDQDRENPGPQRKNVRGALRQSRDEFALRHLHLCPLQCGARLSAPTDRGANMPADLARFLPQTCAVLIGVSLPSGAREARQKAKRPGTPRNRRCAKPSPSVKNQDACRRKKSSSPTDPIGVTRFFRTNEAPGTFIIIRRPSTFSMSCSATIARCAMASASGVTASNGPAS